MQPPSLAFNRLRWVASLKFQIVALTVITVVLSVAVTTRMVLRSMEEDIQRVLAQADNDEVVNTAALLSSKLSLLQTALGAIAKQATPSDWHDTESITRFTADKAALGALFDSVVAVQTNGDTVVRWVKGARAPALRNLADRSYFQQALISDGVVLSDPLVGKLSMTPLIALAMATRGPDGKPLGVLVGTLGLQSSHLFSDVTRHVRDDGSRSVIVNRDGVVLAHPDPARVMGFAADEPGLSKAVDRWRAVDDASRGNGEAVVIQGQLVSWAEIPGSDWMLVRLTPQSVVLKPVLAAKSSAWNLTIAVGLLAATLAGMVAWMLTRPISRLQVRTEKILMGADSAQTQWHDWPRGYGEVGRLANAFLKVLSDRHEKQLETQALLLQLQAVLYHAEVGIAFTRNGHFEMVSRHFCHIFRCEEAQVIGQSTLMIYPSPEAYQAWSARAQPSFMACGAFSGEIELVRQSGEPFWAHMRGRAVVPGDRTKGTVWTVEDVTEVRAHRERLAWESTHDALTSLANRPAFEESLERAAERADTDPFCVLFIDLDRFKQVNDTGGHAAGDALLRDVAQTLAGQVRQYDMVARLGGDEFAVLLVRCNTEHGLAIAEKMRSAVENYRLAWEGQHFSVGASIGLVLANADLCHSVGCTAADVLRAADTACYASKQRGRNCVSVYEPPTPQRLAAPPGTGASSP